MRLEFWKMTAAGNDFVLIRARRAPAAAALARRLCDRRFGVGADGLLTVERSHQGVRVRYFNRDGSAAFCGNGARCAAWWAFVQGWAGQGIRLETGAGVLAARAAGRQRVALAMPDPSGLKLGLKLRAAGRSFAVHAIAAGAPHAVVFVTGLAGFPVELFGSALRRHRALGRAGANVDFVSRVRGGLDLRTYERGVEGETPACGTGAVAAAVVARALGAAASPVRVRVRGGETLKVSFEEAPGGVRGVWLEGPARIVFRGEMNL